jgi:sulfonate transport system ATP-binding protein
MASHVGRLSEVAPVVSVQKLRRGFDGRGVLCGVDLEIRRGEFVALLGRSGSGKTTLLRALARLDGPRDARAARQLRAARADSNGRRAATPEQTDSGELVTPERRAVVFQDARLLPWARVLDNVILGLVGPDARARGQAALAEVGLAGREQAWPLELSGGEQQRVALARSLVRDPELVLLDEPFGALDALTRLRMHELLRELCARHEPAVLLVTHDVDEAIELADRVLVLDSGTIMLDTRIDLGERRSRRSPRFLDYREALLAALGVAASDTTDTTANSAALRTGRYQTRLERTA